VVFWAFTSDIFNWYYCKETLNKTQIESFWEKYEKLRNDFDIRKRAKFKAPFYYMNLLLFSLNKYSDYQKGIFSKELIEGRESHFEKFPIVARMCFSNLRKILK